MNQPNPIRLLTVLEPLWSDPDVTEIMADGYDRVYVERHGRLQDAPTPFASNEELTALLQQVAAFYGLRLDQDTPLLDARLPDGARLNAVLPPVSLTGPLLTINKFRFGTVTIPDLVRWNSISEDMLAFLRACVQGRLNILVTGGVASGKTTILNRIADMIPADERIITIQESTEIQLGQKYVVQIEARPPSLQGEGAITVLDLVRHALRMRPTRLIFTETYAAQLKGGEAMLELIYAINHGHDGTLVGMHAVSVRDALSRLETLIALAHPTIPLLTLRHEIASALNLITYQEYLPDGSRKMLKIAEVVGMQGDAIMTRDVMEFRQTGVESGRVTGYFTATGYVPTFVERLRAASIDMPDSLFQAR